MKVKNQFEKMGVLLCTSNGIYNLKTLKTFMGYIKKLGYNTLYLEISKNYECENEPFFSYMRPKYSIDEMKQIDAFGIEAGITVIPTIQALAHLESIFKWKEYRDLEDAGGVLLVGEPRVYVLIENMIKTISSCFSSGIIHLGMDEAFSLGKGKYRDLHGDRDPVEIMREHVDKVLQIMRKYNVKPEMWGDMYFRLAYGAYDTGKVSFDKSEEVRKTMPKDVKIHYWDYYSLDKEHYIDYTNKFKKITDNIVFDGGVWNYLGFIPDNTYSIKATKAAFEACKECGIKEAVITAWGNTGTETSLFAIMPTLVCAAEFAKGNYDIEASKATFKKLMGMDFDDFINIEIADRLKSTSPENPTGALCDPTRYLLYNDLFNGFLDSTVDESDKPTFKRAALLIERCTKNRKWGYIFKTIKALDEVTELKFDLGLKTRRAYQSGDKETLKALSDNEYTKLIKKMKEFYSCFKNQWYIENKQGGFDIQDIRFGGNILRITHCKEMIDDYLKGKIDRIEELEQKLLCYRGGGENFIKGATTLNEYLTFVTVNSL